MTNCEIKEESTNVTRFCTKCEKQLSPGMKFCQECGAKIITQSNDIEKEYVTDYKLRTSMKIWMIISFVIAALFAIGAIGDISMIAGTVLFGILGVMFLILGQTPKNSKKIFVKYTFLKKLEGLSKNVFVCGCVFISVFLFILIINITVPDTAQSGSNNTDSHTSSDVERTMYSASELENLLQQQPVYVSKTEYIIQDEKYKTLYPDMLQAIIVNNSEHDIKNANVAFVAWDKNNLPVKIKGAIDFSDGQYIKGVAYSDINLVPSSEYGSDSGFEVDENCNIKTFKAVVASYETFDGETWENPYFDEWTELFSGVKLSDELSIEIKQ